MKSTAKDNLLESIQHEIDRQKRLKAAAKTLPIDLFVEKFPQGHWFVSWIEIRFSLPFDFELIAQAKELVEVQVPEAELIRENRFVWNESGKAGHFIEYRYRGHDFTIEFRTETKGSTCVLKKIGEENKVLPIFEVVCAEGAEEPVVSRVPEDLPGQSES